MSDTGDPTPGGAAFPDEALAAGVRIVARLRRTPPADRAWQAYP